MWESWQAKKSFGPVGCRGFGILKKSQKPIFQAVRSRFGE
jgi:hypothetical protein